MNIKKAVVFAILGLVFSLPAAAASYSVAGSGAMVGSVDSAFENIGGTWELLGVADYTAGQDMTLVAADLFIETDRFAQFSLTYQWDSTAQATGGGEWSGTAGLTNCVGSVACIVGNRFGNLELTELGMLDFTLGLRATSGPDYFQFDGTLSLTPVPLPAAAWLFGSACLALAGFGRRLRMNPQARTISTK